MKNKTVPEIADKALAATVSLEMSDQNGAKIYGSGFFVKPNLIATNYHVIAGAISGTAKGVGKDTLHKIEGCTATDKHNDLALLTVTEVSVNPLPLGDSDTVKVGEPVYVAGNPMGLEGTFSDGMISRLHDTTKGHLQMTTPISPGSSGGPVLNNTGAVIGVSVAGRRDMGAQNLNFAIPAKSLKKLIVQTEPATPSWNGPTVSAATYFWRGYALCNLELYDTAIEAYTQAILLEPNYAEVYLCRGFVKGRLGAHAAALSDYDRTIRLKPDDPRAYFLRGFTKTDLGEHTAALRDFDAAIRLKTDYAQAYYRRGLVKADLGEPAAAIGDFDAAIRLKPDYATAYNNRGHAKESLGQTLAAIRDFDEAIRLKPDYATAYFFRGHARGNLEGMWKGKQDIQTALRLAQKAGDTYIEGLAEEALRRIQ